MIVKLLHEEGEDGRQEEKNFSTRMNTGRCFMRPAVIRVQVEKGQNDKNGRFTRVRVHGLPDLPVSSIPFLNSFDSFSICFRWFIQHPLSLSFASAFRLPIDGILPSHGSIVALLAMNIHRCDSSSRMSMTALKCSGLTTFARLPSFHERIVIFHQQMDLVHQAINPGLQLRNNLLHSPTQVMIVRMARMTLWISVQGFRIAIDSMAVHRRVIHATIVLVLMHHGIALIHDVMHKLLDLSLQVDQTLHHRLYAPLDILNIGQMLEWHSAAASMFFTAVKFSFYNVELVRSGGRTDITRGRQSAYLLGAVRL